MPSEMRRRRDAGHEGAQSWTASSLSPRTLGAEVAPGVPFWSPRGCAVLVPRRMRDTNRGDKEGLPSREKVGSAVWNRLRWLGGCWF